MPMRLIIATPFEILAEAADIRALRAEDASGSFGVLPGHTPLLTVLPASVVRWRSADHVEHFCAVGGGVMKVSPGAVSISCREGLLGDDLDALERDIARMRDRQRDAARQKRAEAVHLETRAMRRLIALLQGGGGAGSDGAWT